MRTMVGHVTYFAGGTKNLTTILTQKHNPVLRATGIAGSPPWVYDFGFCGARTRGTRARNLVTHLD